MCTASMYKGLKALVKQALRTADAHGVREEFLAEVGRAWPDHVPHRHTDVAVAAAKAWRFRRRDVAPLGRTSCGVRKCGRPLEHSGGSPTPSCVLAISRPLEEVDRSADLGAVLAGLRG